MGSIEGARKARQKQIEKYGSLEAYQEALRKRASKGGKKGDSGYSTMSYSDRRKYGSLGGRPKKDVELD